MKLWLQDLRFFIGAFFLIVGLLLVAQGFFAPQLTEGVNLNLYAGLGFVLFSSAALASLRA